MLLHVMSTSGLSFSILIGFLEINEDLSYRKKDCVLNA